MCPRRHRPVHLRWLCHRPTSTQPCQFPGQHRRPCLASHRVRSNHPNLSRRQPLWCRHCRASRQPLWCRHCRANRQQLGCRRYWTSRQLPTRLRCRSCRRFQPHLQSWLRLRSWRHPNLRHPNSHRRSLSRSSHRRRPAMTSSPQGLGLQAQTPARRQADDCVETSCFLHRDGLRKARQTAAESAVDRKRPDATPCATSLSLQVEEHPTVSSSDASHKWAMIFCEATGHFLACSCTARKCYGSRRGRRRRRAGGHAHRDTKEKSSPLSSVPEDKVGIRSPPLRRFRALRYCLTYSLQSDMSLPPSAVQLPGLCTVEYEPRPSVNCTVNI